MPSKLHSYRADEINEWGDVKETKPGWARCSTAESRGAPKRYTILVGWAGTRKYPRPKKDAVVPAVWLERKRKEHSSGKRKTLAERLAELPSEVHDACRTHNWHLCATCQGFGLIYHERFAYQIRCRKCRGEGRRHTQAIHGPSITAANKALSSGHPLEEAKQAARAKNPRPNAENWDGTLTTTWERHEFIDSKEAESIRRKVAYRHEETDYDELLDAGYSKEDARLLMTPRKKPDLSDN